MIPRAEQSSVQISLSPFAPLAPLRLCALTLLTCFSTLFSGCIAENNAPPKQYVDIVARGLQFEAPGEIPSGWTTFRLINESEMVHFALVYRMPADYDIEDQQRDVAPVFQQGFDLLAAGQAEAAMQKFGELPPWFQQLVFLGGPGLVSAGRTAQSSVFLDPGRYLIECYVKTKGIFHSNPPAEGVYGMVHQLVVTERQSEAGEPTPTLKISLSAESGIDAPSTIAAGEHTVVVDFIDQKTHENFVGHDVHLARIPDGLELSVLSDWMDWSRPEGLQTPTPVEFFGGTNEMPAGQKSYFTVSLEPGRYAWVAEVTAPLEKKMLVPFTVSAAN